MPPCGLRAAGVLTRQPVSPAWGAKLHGQGFSILLAQEQGHPEVEGEPWLAGGRGEQCLGPGAGQGWGEGL